MVYGVERSGEVKQTESWHLTYIRREQQIVVYFRHCSFSTVKTAERSRLPLLTSLANLPLSCKYVGASPREIWYINTA